MTPTDSTTKPQTEAAPQTAVRTAKLFKNGRSQAVRLPKEFRFEGTEVIVRKNLDTGELILTPTPNAYEKKSWTELFAAWDALGEPDLEFERKVSLPVERDFF
jgi:antitoxin VapB